MSTGAAASSGASSNRRRADHRIRGLACYEEVKELIACGSSIPDVARFIQEDRQEYLDVKRSSLITMLSRYRRRGAPALRLVDTPGFKAAAREAVERACRGIDELEALERLYWLLDERLDRLAAAERETGVLLNPAVTRVVAEQIKVIQAVHDIKMDLGVPREARREKPVIDSSWEAKIGPEAYRAACDPVSRFKVMSLVWDFRTRARQMIEAEQNQSVMNGEVTEDEVALGEKLTAGGANRTVPTARETVACDRT